MSQEGRPYNHGGKVLKDLSVDGVEGRPFELVSPFQPTGDQPGAIEALANGLNQGERYQTLLGVTGSGKTFTVANVIESVQRPTLVLSHNKTLAAQLYQEFKAFFPNNAVEYFVSYYDYYQPEAYMPTSGTYIEKDLSINEEIEKLRLSTTSSLLSGRRDVIVIASVSCLYGMGNPESFTAQVVEIKKGQSISRQALLHQLVQALYSRTAEDLGRGTFRVKGDIVDVFPAYGDSFFRIMFWGDEIESIEQWDPDAMQCLGVLDSLRVFPA
ncbi:MAG: DEAD/DEAH box helicase family protein, partial [Schleiferiaceae bacterium]|nr:DEAD/DEAH box helicase family protein [Schleiferiaceae bacterium]